MLYVNRAMVFLFAYLNARCTAEVHAFSALFFPFGACEWFCLHSDGERYASSSNNCLACVCFSFHIYIDGNLESSS